ncbi:MAG: VWA domain-containing protein [Candidatus Brocadiae bacterium]|nr:VWA domain-containing protein [Candidatus Brocadiia bacterium]
MQFVYPLSFLTLAGIFLFLFTYTKHNIPIIPIATMELWNKQDSSAGYKPKWVFSATLLISVMLYILINLALAHPFFSIKPQRKLFFVLDCSASMQSQIQERRFFDLALDSLGRMLSELDSQRDTISLFLYPQEIQYDGSKDSIQKKLQEIQPCSWGSDLNYFLEKIALGKNDIYFFTDGTELFDKNRFPNIHTICVGSAKSNNLGFISWQARRLGNSQYELFSIAKNFSDHPIASILQFSIEEQKIWEEEVVFLPQEMYIWKKIFSIPSQSKIALKILYKDGFSLDNAIYAVVNQGINLWFPVDAPFFIKVLPDFLPGLEKSSKEDANFYLQPIAQGGWLLQRRETDVPLVIRKADSKESIFLTYADPILWGVYPESMEIAESFPLQEPLPQKTKILIDTRQGAIAAYSDKWLYLGIPLSQNNWYLNPSFPIFWNNAFQFFAKNYHLLPLFLTKDQSKEPGYYLSDKEEFAVSFLYPQESDNRQKISSTFVSLPSQRLAYQTKSLKKEMLFLAILIAGILWNLERK